MAAATTAAAETAVMAAAVNDKTAPRTCRGHAARRRSLRTEGHRENIGVLDTLSYWTPWRSLVRDAWQNVHVRAFAAAFPVLYDACAPVLHDDM